MQTSDVADPSRMQALTREYSRYSRSAGGLSAVLGGMACLASYLAGALLPLTLELRIVLVAMPLLWLVVKQRLAHNYYQRFGQVEELTTSTERRYRYVFAGFTALVSLLIIGSMLWRLAPLGDHPWDLRIAGYMVAVAALPLVVWCWLRTPLEFIVGVFLVCQAALALSGRAYGFSVETAVFPIAAVALIVAGVREHARFVRLRAELASIVALRRVPE